jgi:hypothetical protein
VPNTPRSLPTFRIWCDLAITWFPSLGCPCAASL